MTTPFTLTKATEEVAFNLTKRGITDVPRDINVSLLLDFSGSMDLQYRNGNVSRVLQRLLSISNTIDDDGDMELILFHNNAYHYGTLNVNQYEDTDDIVSDIISKYSMGGTEFAPAVLKALEVLGADTVKSSVAKTRSFFKRLFSLGAQEETCQRVPGKQLLVMISDGDNSDRRDFNETVKLIENMPNVYLQCVSVGYESTYLQQIADQSDSIGYSSLQDFSKTDDALIESIINKELLNKFALVEA